MMIANAVIIVLYSMTTILARSAQKSSPIAMAGQSRDDALVKPVSYQIRRRWLATAVIVPVIPCTVFASHAPVGVENYSRPYVTLLTPVVGILALVLGALLFFILSSKHRAIKSLVFAFLAMVIWGAYGNWSFHRYSLVVDELCSQAGLFVYRTAKVDGFVGAHSIRPWAARGYSYIELEDENGQKFRETLVNGQPHREPIDRFTSRYRVIRHDESEVKDGIRRISTSVVERETGNSIGEVVNYIVPPSPLNRKFRFLPVSESNWVCGHNYFDPKGLVTSVKSDEAYGFTGLITSTLQAAVVAGVNKQ